MPEFVAPTWRGRHVYLRSVGIEDFSVLRMMDLSPELGVRWRFHGSTPSPDQWAQASSIALAQVLVVRSHDDQPIGIASIYQHDFESQHAYFAAAAYGSPARSPLMMMGSALFIDYVFKCWAFRKLYLEMPEYNLAQFATGVGDLFVEEARLGEHVYYDGRRWDKLILALYRRTWEQRGPRLLAAALPTQPRRVSLRRPEVRA
jgi:RimJ/RimL family protein N-acetyltransferase